MQKAILADSDGQFVLSVVNFGSQAQSDQSNSTRRLSPTGKAQLILLG
jgi:hypothetical protein